MGNSPGMILTAPTPPPNTQTSFHGYSEVPSGANIVAGSQVAAPQWQQTQANRAPCPVLAFLEQGVPLSQEQVQALETIRSAGNALASLIPPYYQAKAQRMPCPTPTAPPSHSSLDNSTVTDLPSYACPGARRDPTEKKTGPYGCPMCPHRSNRKNDILKHMTMRNSAVRYYCHHGSCGGHRTFSRKHKYTEHLRKTHSGAPHDVESVERAGVPRSQHYPETCLHCPQTMRSFDHWYKHWMDRHNGRCGREIPPISWPASASQERTPRPNLAVPGIPVFGPGLVGPGAQWWAPSGYPLEGLYMENSFPRHQVQEAMQGVNQHFPDTG